MILEKNIFVIFSIALFSITSCVLPLESIKNFDEIKKIGKTELSSFNGNYRIESTDSFHMLSYVFMYKDIFDRNKMPTLYDYINICSVLRLAPINSKLHQIGISCSIWLYRTSSRFFSTCLWKRLVAGIMNGFSAIGVN